MDVVKGTIEGLRGDIDVSSQFGKGTKATLHLPLTLAIVEAMLVRVGGSRFAIPLAAVQECIELPASADVTKSGRSFLDILGSLVPFLSLRDVFGTSTAIEDHQRVVVVSSGEGRVGLVVDQIIGNAQTAIRQLSRPHADVKAFSGETILGDGTVALILDTAHFIRFGRSYIDQAIPQSRGPHDPQDKSAYEVPCHPPSG